MSAPGSERLPGDREAQFPKLDATNYRKTSPETIAYNCVGHVLGRQDAWFQGPPADPWMEWPEGVSPGGQVDDYIRLFEHYGFVECSDRTLEQGFTKIAIFSNNYALFSHVAIQLEEGKWSSKLGSWEDIEHETLEAIEDQGRYPHDYGEARVFMKRPNR